MKNASPACCSSLLAARGRRCARRRAAPTSAWSRRPINRLDDESLQRGARNFVNYCLNCHTREVHALQPADGPRPDRGADRGQPDVRDRQDRRDDDGRDDACRRQGVVRRGAARPVGRVARARRATGCTTTCSASTGTTQSATGWNNLVFPNVGMPHVLWELSGINKLVDDRVRGSREGDGGRDRRQGHCPLSSRCRDTSTSCCTVAPDVARHDDAACEYEAFVADLVNYMDYMAEPVEEQADPPRHRRAAVPRRAVRLRVLR